MQSFFNFGAWNFYLSLFCIIYLFLRTQAVGNKTQCSDILTNIRTLFDKSPVIRQKGESQNGCFKKTKHAKFPDKRTFLTCWYAHTYVCVSGGKKYSFFGKFGVFCFLENLVLRFALLPCTDELLKLFNWYWAVVVKGYYFCDEGNRLVKTLTVTFLPTPPPPPPISCIEE